MIQTRATQSLVDSHRRDLVASAGPRRGGARGDQARQDMPAAYEKLAFAQALESWMGAVYACNAYTDEQAPWTLRKTDPARMQTVLATLYIVIAQLAVAVLPVMPEAMTRLLDTMGLSEELRTVEGMWSHWYSPLAESGYRLDQPVGLFPRIELPENEAA